MLPLPTDSDSIQRGITTMSDRSHALAATDIVALPGTLVLAPAPRPPVVLDGEIDRIAADLESVVDSRTPRLRRAMDVAIAAASLVALAPLMLVIAAAVKLDSRGPVLYMQERIGINRRRQERRRDRRAARGRREARYAGRPFRIYKFRTMRIDAEAAGPQWASNRDPRITRVGRVLRKARFDEIPQFFNVLRGDMTLIGPRPERPFFVERLENEVPHYSKRLLVKPGITGMAQVHHKYDDSIESVHTKVKWDLRYIRQQGIKADLSIVAHTIRVVLTGEGAC
jgi:lipopolysaccharide/colanic/teichoic acid biosynthesis glycosyltransferase